MGRGIVSGSKEQDFQRDAGSQMVLDWLRTPNAPTRVVMVTGAAGMGKTRLLQSLLREAKEYGAATLTVDGIYEGQTPDDFLKIVAQVGWIRRHEFSVTEFTFSTAPGGKRVMCIDHLDEWPALVYWLRTVFAEQLPAEGFMFILATRNERRGVGSWRASAVKIENIHLVAIKPQEALGYLMSLGMAHDERMMALIRTSHGHPALLNRLATSDLDTKGIRLELSDMARRLLTEVDLSTALPGVEALSILREANQEHLSALLEEPLSTEEYFALSCLSFVHKGLNGLTMEDSVATILQHDLYHRAPKRFITWVQRAVAVWAERMADCTFEQKTSCLSYILSVYAEYHAEITGDSERVFPGENLGPSVHSLSAHFTQTSELPLQDWLNGLFTSTSKIFTPTVPQPKAIRLVEEDIRDSLRHFHHTQYLTEFAKERQLNLTGDAFRDLMLGFLVTEQVPPPFTKEQQRILRVTYMDRHGNAEAIANRLAISRTTYYRQLAEAHRNFAEVFTV
jgi:hypothetical protein